MGARKIFKIWIHIEEVRIGRNGEEDPVDGDPVEPTPAGEFPSLRRAEAARDTAVDALERVSEPRVGARVIDILARKHFDFPLRDARALVREHRELVQQRSLAGDSDLEIAQAVISAEATKGSSTKAEPLSRKRRQTR